MEATGRSHPACERLMQMLCKYLSTCTGPTGAGRQSQHPTTSNTMPMMQKGHFRVPGSWTLEKKNYLLGSAPCTHTTQPLLSV